MKSKLSGSVIDFNASFSLKLKDEIGSGSFSSVYSTSDPHYVVKMINSTDPKSFTSFKNEKNAFLNIPKHENIVNCPAYKDSYYAKGINYCCFALENCSKGSIIGMIVDKKVTFQEHQIFRILFEVTLGLHQMHSLSKPIAHRDLKGENVLLGDDGHFKLTDFGSISTNRIESITSANRDEIQEDIDQNTTPTIRGPEQCDLYSGFPITEKVDIWALGCLLYILCYHRQPFESKLSTVNCKYYIPPTPQYSKTLTGLFGILLQINPKDRPSTLDLLRYFEKQMSSSISSLASAIEENNEQVNNYDRVRGYKTSSGVQQTYSPPEKTSEGRSARGANEALRIQFVNSEESKVKPLFKDVIQKFVAKISTKTEAWMLSAVEENQKGPSQQNVQLLIVKSWNKPEKIAKFYSLLHKKYQRNPESTIIVVKTLITLHNYFRKGPNDVYLTRGPPSGRQIINSISQTWKNIFAKGLTTSKDMARNTYSTQLIVEYSDILLKKFDLQMKYHRTFQGNYAMEPYFLFPVEENSPIAPHVLEGLLNFLDQLTNFHKMLFQDQHLLKIQCSIASSILDEEYCLISVLAHILATFKYATNYMQVPANSTAIENRIKDFEANFQHSYEKASQFFETCRQMPEFQYHRGTIPRLPIEVLEEIGGILILMNYRNETFQMKKFLNHDRMICGLGVPRSYREVAMNVGLNYPPRPRLSVRTYTIEPQHQSHSKSFIDDIPFTESKTIKQTEINQHGGSRQHHHPSRAKNNSLSNIERPEPIQKIQKDFNPNFDVYNDNRPASSHIANGIYAGFNFGMPEGQNPQLSSQEQKNNAQDAAQFFMDPEAENKPEDLEMVFSHQFINTSFLKPGQAPPGPALEETHSAPPEMKAAEPVPNTQVVNSMGIAKGQSEPPQVQNRPNPQINQQNLVNVKPQQNPNPVPNVVQNQYSSVPTQSQVQALNVTPRGNVPQIDLLSGSVMPSQRQNNIVNNNANMNMQAQVQGQVQNQPVFAGQPNFPVQQAYPYGQQNNVPIQNAQNFNMNPSMQKNMMNNGQMVPNYGPQPFQNQSMNNNWNNQGYLFQGQRNMNQNPYQNNMNNMMPNMPQNQFNQPQSQPQMQMQINLSQQKPQNQIQQSNYNQPVIVNPQVNQSPASQPVIVQQVNQPQAQVQSQPNKPSPNKNGNMYAQQLEQAWMQKDEVTEEVKEKDIPKFEGPLDELDFLFKSSIETKKIIPSMEIKKEEVKQNPSPPKQNQNQNLNKNQNQNQINLPDFVMSLSQGEWDGVFNIQKNVEAQKQMEIEKDRKRKEEEALKAKQTQMSLADAPNITTSHLQKFIFQEISKNAADWIIDYKQLKFISQIGSGGSAEVYRGIWRGTDVAIKKMKLNNMPESRKKEFEREISALMKLRPHQNLVNFMGVSIESNELCVVMEFCSGGTLFEWLHVKKEVQITFKQKLKMAIDVACGLNYLHTCNPPIIHRDMKSLNLLVDGPIERNSQRFVVKLADFGLAKPQELNQDKMTGVMGTYHWMAPEIFENKDYSIKADVYSYAVVLWEIITRETPYPHLRNPAAIMKFVTIEKGRPDLSRVPNNCPKQIIDLMVECWDEDPDRRPFFSEVLERLKALESWHFN